MRITDEIDIEGRAQSRHRRSRALTTEELREAGMSNHELVAMKGMTEAEEMMVRLSALDALMDRQLQAYIHSMGGIGWSMSDIQP